MIALLALGFAAAESLPIPDGLSRLDRFQTLQAKGESALSRGDLGMAEAWFEAGRRTASESIAREPEEVLHWQDLRVSCIYLARLARETGRIRSAYAMQLQARVCSEIQAFRRPEAPGPNRNAALHECYLAMAALEMGEEALAQSHATAAAARLSALSRQPPAETPDAALLGLMQRLSRNLAHPPG